MATAPDYSSVTESPGNRVTREAMDMLLTRYDWAAAASAGRDVLEVGCGAGHGLGYIASTARRVVGGDYTTSLLTAARRQYGHRVPLVRLDGQALPFGDATFDVVLLFEAIYYLPDAGRFVAECRRVLREGGRLLICSANCETGGFNASPLSTRYFSAHDLGRLLGEHGFDVRLFGAFPAAAASGAGRVVSLLKRLAVKWHLIPKTMTGKEVLKRLFLGPLESFPAELKPGSGTPHALAPLTTSDGRFKVVYAEGVRRI